MMMMTTRINMAKDFSVNPAGRTFAQGAHNAETFREKLLAPALREPRLVLVNLSGISGMSASYVQEAFGKLVEEFDLADLDARLKIVASDDGSLVKQVWQVIREAADYKRAMAN